MFNDWTTSTRGLRSSRIDNTNSFESCPCDPPWPPGFTPGGSGGGKPFYASVVLAGDKLICVSRRDGTYVLAAKAEFEQLAHNQFESDESDFNASPAVSDGKLFLRSNRYLYCIADIQGR